jgi:hypothetical protein
VSAEFRRPDIQEDNTRLLGPRRSKNLLAVTGTEDPVLLPVIENGREKLEYLRLFFAD